MQCPSCGHKQPALIPPGGTNGPVDVERLKSTLKEYE